RKGGSGVHRSEEAMTEEKGKTGRDELARSLEDLFINDSTMIKGELQVPYLVMLQDSYCFGRFRRK
ncbi:hypothetical protein GW17_00034806, partial [Ensete ventricosum]